LTIRFGFRIEPGEIELVLRQHLSVREAVVIAREDQPGQKRLVAYIVGDENLSIWSLRKLLRGKLPEYMIPAHFARIENLPLLPNGKVNYKTISKLDRGIIEIDKQYVAPSTYTETVIAKIWCDELGLEKIGLNDKFFDVGGHSLLSVKVMARIEQELGVQINFRDTMLETLGQLAKSCEEKLKTILLEAK
jgi:non-ribosomal peptide synthetase component E (peptide arylation enzyme)